MKKVLAVFLLCSCTVFIATPAAVVIAGNGLSPVKGSGGSQLLPPDTDPTTPDAVGAVTLTIGDQEYDLGLEVYLTGMEYKGESIHVAASHVLSGAGIDFSTLDKEILTPTTTPGLYRLNSNSKVVGGGKGHLTFHGTIDFVTGQVSFDIKGAMRLD